jgi:tetratricopeptide (TPR) repeat protein
MDQEIVDKALELEDAGEFQECIRFLNENISNIGSPHIRSDAYRILSECYLYQENPEIEKAKEFAERSIDISQELNDEHRMAESYLLFSQILSQIEDPKSLEFAKKAVELFEKSGDRENYIYSLISLATILEDFKEASELFKKAIELSSQDGNLDMEAQATINYAYLLAEKVSGDEALKVIDSFIDKIMKEASKLKKKKERIDFVNNYEEIFSAASDIAMDLEQYDLATKYASFLNKDPLEKQK